MISSSRVAGAAARTTTIALTTLIVLYALFELTARPATVVGIRWSTQATLEDKRDVEATYRLWNGRVTGPVNSVYDLLNTSRRNIRGLVNDPRVADTAGVNRETFERNPADDSDDTITSVLARLPVLGDPRRMRWFVILLLLIAVPGAAMAATRALTREAARDTLSRGRAAGIVALVVIGAGLFRFATFGNRLGGDDHFSLWAAAAAYHGAVPYKDFFDPGAPLYWWLALLGQIVSGYRVIGEIGVATLLITIAYTLAFAQSWRASRNLWLSLAVLAIGLILVLPTGTYAYPKLFVYPVVLTAAWAYVDRQTTPRLTAMAATMAMAFLFRHDHGMFVVSAPFMAIVVTSWGRFGLMLKRLVSVALLTIAILLPWLIWVQATEGLLVYFPARLQQSLGAGLLEDRPRLGVARPFFEATNAGPWLFTLWKLLPVATLLVVGVERWRNAPERFPREHAYMAVAGALTLTATQGLMRELGRFCDIATLGIVPLAWLAGRAMVSGRERHVSHWILATVASAVLIVTAISAAVFAHLGEYVPGRYPGETLALYRQSMAAQIRTLMASPPIDAYAPPDADDDLQLIRYFRECTRPDDAIWDMNQNFAWPYYAERQNVLHPEWASGFKRRPEDQAYAIAWVKRRRVPILFSINIDPMQSLDQYPQVKTFVQSRYRDAATPAFYRLFGKERRDAWIMVDTTLTPSGTYERLGLPCYN